jgi:hypothetical protein
VPAVRLPDASDRRMWRRVLAQLHPDREGGDAEAFAWAQQVREHVEESPVEAGRCATCPASYHGDVNRPAGLVLGGAEQKRTSAIRYRFVPGSYQIRRRTAVEPPWFFAAFPAQGGILRAAPSVDSLG